MRLILLGIAGIMFTAAFIKADMLTGEEGEFKGVVISKLPDNNIVVERYPDIVVFESDKYQTIEVGDTIANKFYVGGITGVTYDRR